MERCVMCKAEGTDINYSGSVLKDGPIVVCLEHVGLLLSQVNEEELDAILKQTGGALSDIIEKVNFYEYINVVNSTRSLGNHMSKYSRKLAVMQTVAHIAEQREEEEEEEKKREGIIAKTPTVDKDLFDTLEMIDEDNKYNDVETSRKDNIFKVEDVIKELDKVIIGQQDAKEILTLAFQNHLLRKESELDIPKSNVLLMGPTGSGKTLLVRTLCDMLEIPFFEADMTQMTSSGYQGSSISSIFLNMLYKFKGNIEEIENSVIYLDEIDKISSNGDVEGRDVTGLGVQQELLKILEGTKLQITNGNNPQPITIDTSNILFVCTGAFENREAALAEKNKLRNKSNIGFSGTAEPEVKVTKIGQLQDRVDGLKEYGLSPELLGRLPIVTSTTKLETKQIASILKNIQLDSYTNLFKARGLELKVTNPAINHIADLVYELPTGARSITTIMNEILKKPQLYPAKYLSKDGIIKLGINEVKEMLL